MKKQSLYTVEDKEFGEGAPYAFPGDIHEARRLLALCRDLKSSADYLKCDFYNAADIDDVRERFQGVTEWPLPYLVASAAYYFLAWRNRTAKKICNVGRIDAFDWENLFLVLLTVGEPLFEIIHRNKWAEPNRESIREGFRVKLYLVIEFNKSKSRYRPIRWFHEKGRSWFQIDWEEEIAYPGKCYPDNVFRCLVLAGINETVARLAVKEVFESKNLSPFYTALLSAADINFLRLLGKRNTDKEFTL